MSLVNLLPEDYVARQSQKRANLLCAILFAVVMASVLAAAVVSEQGYRHTREVRQRVDHSYADAGKMIEQLQDLEATRGKMLQKASLTAGLLERVPRSGLLAAITNALPEGASLTKLEMTGKRDRTVVITKDSKTQFEAAAAAKAANPAGAPNPDVVLTATGLAGTDVEVARFIAAMARCPLMDTVDLVYSQEKKVAEVVGHKPGPEQVVREFQVVMRLRPDADVRRPSAGAPAMAQAAAAGRLEPTGESR